MLGCRYKNMARGKNCLLGLIVVSLAAGCIGSDVAEFPLQTRTEPEHEPLVRDIYPANEVDSTYRSSTSYEDWYLKVNSSEWSSPEVSKASSMHAPLRENDDECSPWGGPDTRVGEIETLEVHAWGDADARNHVYITITVPEGFAVVEGPLQTEGVLEDAPIRFNLTLRAEAPGCWIVKIGSGYVGGGIVRDRQFVYRVTTD